MDNWWYNNYIDSIPGRLLGPSDISEILSTVGIVDRSKMDWYNKVNRNSKGVIDPYTTLTGAREYVFFTKPDLNILESNGTLVKELQNQDIFVDAKIRYPEVLNQLCYKYPSGPTRTQTPFCYLLSNAMTGTMTVPDVSADTIDTAANVYGTSIAYRTSGFKSDNSLDLTIDFQDSKYLEVYMFFKLYEEYQRLKRQGVVGPTQAQIFSKVLHDQMSAYKIVTREDGMTIMYFAEYTGLFPTSVPREAFSTINGTDVKLDYSVNWHCQFFRDSNPVILSRFNTLIKPYFTRARSMLPVYNQNTQRGDHRWALAPVITTMTRYGSPMNPRHPSDRYYLEWIGTDY